MSVLIQLVFALYFSAGAVPPTGLAYRDPHISYRNYIERARAQVRFNGAVVEEAIPVRNLDTTKIVAWDSVEQVNEAFAKVRDLRFLYTEDMPQFQRRSSWLYPDDGCFDRAALANSNLREWNYPVPNKLFVFGDLYVKTLNHPDGFVTWWYHVVPVVRVVNQAYVIDPAIDSSQAIKLIDWLKSMTTNGNINNLQVSLCGSGAYIPERECNLELKKYDKTAATDQLRYLDYEWERLQDLGRDPEEELGDNPPWSRKGVSALLGLRQ